MKRSEIERTEHYLRQVAAEVFKDGSCRPYPDHIEDAADIIKTLLQRVDDLESRIDWALRVKRSGMVGFVPDMLHGHWKVLDLQLHEDSSFTLRSFVEAVEREAGYDEDLLEEDG